MKMYIALLRGINVGGHKKILMTDLKLAIEKLGFQEVQTYIQSGNVVFKAKLVAKACKKKFLKPSKNNTAGKFL